MTSLIAVKSAALPGLSGSASMALHLRRSVSIVAILSSSVQGQSRKRSSI